MIKTIMLLAALAALSCSADYAYDTSRQSAPPIEIERRFYRWFGDVNFDGMLTLGDVQEVSAHVYAGKRLTNLQRFRADVNRDMRIDSLDINLMIKNLHGNGR